MLSNIYYNKETDKVKNSNIQQENPILNYQSLQSYNYYNPVTFLFPELISHGKIDLNKTIHFNGILFHTIVKLMLIFLYFFEIQAQIYWTLLLVSLDFWINKNYSGRKLIGLTWWIDRDDTQDLWYFEKVNKLYPLNSGCKHYFWCCLYIFQFLLFTILITTLIQCKLKQALILIIPLIVNLIQIHIYIQTQKENETFRYLQDLTDYRMRRSIKCKFQVWELPHKLIF